ncbi:hypothetical protein NRB56_43870 [Nocardia sp. RB56]|uniref:Uncharacterized protein n=1 Tax=Nocardia aurantia TaxID=2585199 RepID=A0A7K0DSQ3_9NOCA|nr:hypothetical protein [Nocardia aurantia]
MSVKLDRPQRRADRKHRHCGRSSRCGIHWVRVDLRQSVVSASAVRTPSMPSRPSEGSPRNIPVRVDPDPAARTAVRFPSAQSDTGIRFEQEVADDAAPSRNIAAGPRCSRYPDRGGTTRSAGHDRRSTRCRVPAATRGVRAPAGLAGRLDRRPGARRNRHSRIILRGHRRHRRRGDGSPPAATDPRTVHAPRRVHASARESCGTPCGRHVGGLPVLRLAGAAVRRYPTGADRDHAAHRRAELRGGTRGLHIAGLLASRG